MATEAAACPHCGKTDSEHIKTNPPLKYEHQWQGRTYNTVVWQRRRCRGCDRVFMSKIRRNL